MPAQALHLHAKEVLGPGSEAAIMHSNSALSMLQKLSKTRLRLPTQAPANGLARAAFATPGARVDCSRL